MDRQGGNGLDVCKPGFRAKIKHPRCASCGSPANVPHGGRQRRWSPRGVRGASRDPRPKLNTPFCRRRPGQGCESEMVVRTYIQGGIPQLRLSQSENANAVNMCPHGLHTAHRTLRQGGSCDEKLFPCGDLGSGLLP